MGGTGRTLKLVKRGIFLCGTIFANFQQYPMNQTVGKALKQKFPHQYNKSFTPCRGKGVKIFCRQCKKRKLAILYVYTNDHLSSIRYHLLITDLGFLDYVTS